MAFQSKKVNSKPPEEIILSEEKLSKEDKWKAVSHLQKCIRRGWVELVDPAVRMCYEIDPAYTRYRLSVIAFEDIAGGNPEQIAKSFEKGWTKKAIEEQGGLEWLVTQATLWASGPKDRLASDLLACIVYLDEFEKIHTSFDLLTIDKALDLAWDESLPWWSRALGFWRAIGTIQYPDERLPKIAGDLEKVMAKNLEKGLSSFWNDCLIAGKSQRESAPVFLPLVAWGLAQNSINPMVELPSEKNIPFLIGPWVSISLDKHTREGQKALSWAWFNAGWKERFEAYHASQNLALDAVGRMQFWMEGGLLDKSPQYELKKKVSLEIRKKYIETWPFSAKQLHSIAGSEEVWNKARQIVIGGPTKLGYKK